MTDTELVHQVEQAMLGAMVARPRRIGGLPGGVTPDLFTDERHQAIAAALTGTAGEGRGLLGRFRDFLARFSRRARETGRYMDTLPGRCPDAGHIDSYYRILAEARALREATGLEAAGQAAQNTRMLDAVGHQLAVQTGDAAAVARAPGDLSPAAARLARALSARTQPGQAPAAEEQAAASREGAPQQPAPVLPRTQGQAGAPPAAAPVVPAAAARAADAGAAPQAANGNGQAAGLPQATRPQDVQDLILASLLRHPDEARDVTAWLPAAAFPEGPRRELYAMIGEFTKARREIDPLIMAWAADLKHSAGPSGETWAAGEGWATPGFTLAVGSLNAAPGTAAVLGRLLLADHMLTTEAASAANGGSRARHAAPMVAGTPEPAVGQVPEVAHDTGRWHGRGQAAVQRPVPPWQEPAPSAQEQATSARQQPAWEESAQAGAPAAGSPPLVPPLRQPPVPAQQRPAPPAQHNGSGARAGAGEADRSVRIENAARAAAAHPAMRPPAPPAGRNGAAPRL